MGGLLDLEVLTLCTVVDMKETVQQDRCVAIVHYVKSREVVVDEMVREGSGRLDAKKVVKDMKIVGRGEAVTKVLWMKTAKSKTMGKARKKHL